MDNESGCTTETLVQAHNSRIPNVPVVLIHVRHNFGGSAVDFESKEFAGMARVQETRTPFRLKFHQEWVNQIPDARMVIAENSSHGGINFEEPDLVIRTIRDVLNGSASRLTH